MILDSSIKGELTVNMIPYVRLVLDSIPKDMVGRAATPAASYLYHINDKNPQYLNTARAETFHSHYLAQRRLDILEAFSFLTTRAQMPDTDDNKKLARVMKYLQSTETLVLRLSTTGDGVLHWWVDASYAVHPNMSGHTGGTLSMGKGSVYSTSKSQKGPARSSTESEIFGVYDVLPQIEWTKVTLEAQGYSVRDTILSGKQEHRSCWKRTVRRREANVLSTSIFYIFTSKTRLTQVRSGSNTVQRKICWPTSSPSHCKEACSVIPGSHHEHRPEQCLPLHGSQECVKKTTDAIRTDPTPLRTMTRTAAS